MFESLSSDGRLVRVNLRPWRAAGHAPEAVLNAFVRTAGTLPLGYGSTFEPNSMRSWRMQRATGFRTDSPCRRAL